MLVGTYRGGVVDVGGTAYRGGVVDVGADGPVVERHGGAAVAGQLCHRLLSVQPLLELS